MSDYSKALADVKSLPPIHIGQEVKTPLGKGIVVKIEMDYNGLYIMPERTKVDVWFGTERDSCGWITKSFNISSIKVNLRKEKLEKLNEKILENKL